MFLSNIQITAKPQTIISLVFARKEKALLVAVLKPEPIKNIQFIEDAGIHLGEGYYWNPEALPKGIS